MFDTCLSRPPCQVGQHLAFPRGGTTILRLPRPLAHSDDRRSCGTDLRRRIRHQRLLRGHRLRGHLFPIGPVLNAGMISHALPAHPEPHEASSVKQPVPPPLIDPQLTPCVIYVWISALDAPAAESLTSNNPIGGSGSELPRKQVASSAPSAAQLGAARWRCGQYDLDDRWPRVGCSSTRIG